MASSSPTAGGVLIAAGAIVGAGVGVYLRQPTLGFLAGLGIGVAVAVLIWLRQR